MQKQREKIIGTTIITRGNRISLLKDVKKLLQLKFDIELKEGDKIVYFQNEEGDIVIRPA